MKRFMNKKVATIGLAAGLALGIAGSAFAYFTSTGTGTGSASTGSSAGLNIAQTNTVSNLLPGGPSETIDYKVTNNTSSAENVGQVTVTVASVTSGTLTGTDSEGNTIQPCSTTFYPIVQGSALNTDLQPGGTATGTATISMTDSGNQDNCQAANGGGALTLSFSSN
jgi:hypothetical protein